MLRNYLKIAWKVLLRRKFFTFISLFGIGLTLVVLLVVAAFLDHVVGSFAPETRLDRTAGIFHARLQGEHWRRTGWAGFALLDGYARDLPNVERLSIASLGEGVYSYLNGERVKSYVKRTDGDFWQILQFTFLEGGPFTNADLRDARRVAVINASTRQRFFGGEPALGRTIELENDRFTVVGVVPDVPILRIVPFADVWIPYTASKSDAYRRELVGNFIGILLLQDPSKLSLTREEFQSRISRITFDDPNGFQSVEAVPETFVDAVGRIFIAGGTVDGTSYGTWLRVALAVAACLFMLLPAVNLVNLNTSRIMERASEIGVRKAFGASSRTLVGQFVIENVVLTLVGAGIGLLVAGWVLHLVNGSGMIPYADLRLNYRIFGWGLVLAVFFGLVSGVYPAWRMSRLHPVQALKGAAR